MLSGFISDSSSPVINLIIHQYCWNINICIYYWSKVQSDCFLKCICTANTKWDIWYIWQSYHECKSPGIYFHYTVQSIDLAHFIAIIIKIVSHISSLINFIACLCSASHLQTWASLLSHNTMGFVRPFQEHKPFLCLVKVKECLNQIASQFSLSLFLFHTSNGCGKLGTPFFEVLIVSSLWWEGEKWAFTDDVENENTQGHAKTRWFEQHRQAKLCRRFAFQGVIWHMTKYFKELITIDVLLHLSVVAYLRKWLWIQILNM